MVDGDKDDVASVQSDFGWEESGLRALSIFIAIVGLLGRGCRRFAS